jgi:uncharacterized membrane protein YbhN (UPF0104 family)
VLYYTTHPWRFGCSLLLHFVAFAFDDFHTVLMLYCLLGDSVLKFPNAVMAVITVTALDQVFFFVPGRLGTLEGIRFTVLSALGVTPVYALAFGLLVRLESLFWNGLGLLAYALCTRSSLFPHPVQPIASPPTALPPTTC